MSCLFCVSFLYIFLSLCRSLSSSLVRLYGDCFPVVVVLDSVLQHDLAPRDIEEMLEVGYLATSVPRGEFSIISSNAMQLPPVIIHGFHINLIKAYFSASSIGLLYQFLLYFVRMGLNTDFSCQNKACILILALYLTRCDIRAAGFLSHDNGRKSNIIRCDITIYECYH